MEWRGSACILTLAQLAALPALSVTGEAVIAMAGGLVQLSQDGGAFSPIGTLAGTGWTRDNATSVVRLTTATDFVSIGTAVPPANTKFYVRGPDSATVVAAFERRAGQGADLLTVIDANSTLVVFAVDDNGNTEIRRAGTAAGSDSRELHLLGQTNTATRALALLNEADAGADDYRLRVNDHTGGAFLLCERLGAGPERRTRIQASLALDGTLTPAALAANANNIATLGASVLLQDTTGNFNASGFADGYDGKLLYVQNISNVAGGTNVISITHEDAASTASNRVRCPNNATVAVRNNGAALLRYRGAISRWQVMSVI